MTSITHTPNNLAWINAEMAVIGVNDFRFCIENDCYVCDSNGNFYGVCVRQYSKSGNLIENYRIKKLSGSVDKDGYRTYRIVVDGVKRHLKAHRMMLNAWIGERPELAVNHIDGNKKNNCLTNLEWCTVAENNAHAIRTGLLNPKKQRRRFSVLTCDWVTVYILHKHCGYSLCELGRMYRCTHSTITAIILRLEKVLPKEVLYG